ncbi:MAG: SCO family protein [Ferruginibacter sp.]
MKKWHWYVGFFVLLFGVYFIYFFSQEDFAQSSLPVINNNIQPFSFINQNGKAITDRDIEGKVYVTEYFFTTCKGICPKMNANMRRVYDTYRTDSNFMIISHTCMPETDSVPLLKKYEQKMLGGNLLKTEDGSYRIEYDTSLAGKQAYTNPSWNFVTGDKMALYKMARQSYMIDNNKPEDTTGNISNQFIHTQFFALVDKKSRVRGIYDGLKEEEIQKLLKDVKEVLKEKYQSRSLNN